MKRTLLHYPTIKIPDESWIRQAILYWDEIGSIIPHGEFHYIRHNRAQFELSNLGLLRIFNPEDYVQKNETLAHEYIEIVESGVFGEPIKDVEEAVARDSYIYEAKFMHEVKHYLVNQGFAKQINKKVYIDWRLALLYMAMLAKYMANDDTEAITTPSTLHPKYRDLVFSTTDKSKSLPGVSFSLNGILPVPREDAPIRKIIEFKVKYQDELSEFRRALIENQNKIRDAKEVNDAKEFLEQFKTSITKEVNSISETLNKEKLPFVLGLFENILSINSPAVTALATLLIPSLTIPVPIVAAGAAVGGAITITKYFLDKENERQKHLSVNSYSYLYYANKQGIIA